MTSPPPPPPQPHLQEEGPPLGEDATETLEELASPHGQLSAPAASSWWEVVGGRGGNEEEEEAEVPADLSPWPKEEGSPVPDGYQYEAEPPIVEDLHEEEPPAVADDGQGWDLYEATPVSPPSSTYGWDQEVSEIA